MKRSERGGAFIEFAIVVPMLALLLVGIIETGRYMAFGVRLSNAAHAGAQFGALNRINAQNTADIESAACSDAGFTCTTATPAPAQTTPPDTMLVSTTWPCTSKTSPCPDGSYYVQVSTSATFRPLLRYPLFGSSVKMSAQATQLVMP